MARYPEIVTVHQHFERPQVRNIAATVRDELSRISFDDQIRAGDRIAITAGSRGITNIQTILRTAVDFCKECGGVPWIVPSMGSHGGATAEGQQNVLAGLGLTEESLGCSIDSDMETVLLDTTEDGIPIYFDKRASESDHVLVCGRVKPHTGFAGVYQSGLMKMLLNGMGNHRGAQTYHRAAVSIPFDRIVETACPMILKKAPIRAGLAIVENAYGETAGIHGVQCDDFQRRQQELLCESQRLMAKLPLEQIDILLIDEIGKSISGTGMDTNIVGRKLQDHAPGPEETPAVRTIAIRGVRGGNGNGIGLAEFCTSRAVAQTDWEATRINGLTAMHVAATMIPVECPNDRDMLDRALQTIGLRKVEDAKLVWIKNTKELDTIVCSTACLAELQNAPGVSPQSDCRPLRFDTEGNLPDDE
ncbi:MAG: lactate racemase domain-containing protein [Planctomycetota bacterium]|nr:lactate racemase domain-containing protein [Planctomycetota bacterium]